jgi:hypothetical protein
MNNVVTASSGLAYFDDPANWETKAEHRYKARQLWFPLAHAVTQWENEFHELCSASVGNGGSVLPLR